MNQGSIALLEAQIQKYEMQENIVLAEKVYLMMIEMLDTIALAERISLILLVYQLIREIFVRLDSTD